MLLFCALLGSLNRAKPALRGRGEFLGEVCIYWRSGRLSGKPKLTTEVDAYGIFDVYKGESYNFKRTSNPGCDTEVALENDGQPCEVS